MKRILILAMLFSLNSVAQPQITWQKYFHTSNSIATINYIIQTDSSGFVAGTVYPQANPSCRIIRLDSHGDTLWVQKKNWGGRLINCYNSGFLATSYTSFAQFIRLDPNFDSLWTISYPQYTSLTATSANDSGFILNSSSTVIKTDSLGVIQWTQSFFGTIRKVIPCKNGDILVVGFLAGFHNTYVSMLLTATGQLLWQQHHGVISEDWGTIKEFGINDAVELPDGNFLAASGSYHPHINDSSGWDMIKIDRATGDTLQTFVFDTMTYSTETKIFMTYAKDSNILICADDMLLKIKPDASILWFRYSPIVVWDMIACNDNGLAIAGFTGFLGNPLKYSAYAKLDSLGNIYNYQGIPYIQPQLVSVYPNPASNQLTIDNLQLTNKPFTLTVYDVLGKAHLTQNANASTIDISTLTPGLYVLRLQQGDKMYYGRFVKE